MNLHGYKGCECRCWSMKSLPVYLSRYTKLIQNSRHSLGSMHKPFAEGGVRIILFDSLIPAAHVA